MFKLRLAVVKYSFLAVLVLGIYLGALQLTGNFHETIPGDLYRSAQLSKDDISKYANQYGIKSILNLRGDNTGEEWYDSEVAESKARSIKHIDFRMSAKRELTDQQASELIEIMKNAPKPLLIHCRSGADRTGLAVALYIAGVKKGSEFDAELQLSLLYGHVPLWFTKAYAMNRTFEHLEPSLGYIGS